MILISHRGNITGKIESRENTISYVNEALIKGYNVEIDIWLVNDILYMCHDLIIKKENKINTDFLKNEKLWIHCKTINTFYFLNEKLNNNNNLFFHNRDDIALTTKGYLWTYPGCELTSNSIALDTFESYTLDEIKKCKGICSDNIEIYQNL